MQIPSVIKPRDITIKRTPIISSVIPSPGPLPSSLNTPIESPNGNPNGINTSPTRKTTDTIISPV